MEKIFMNTKNSKINDPHKFVLSLPQGLHLRSLNKHVPLINWSIYYTCKNMSQQYKNKKLQILAPTWNDELELTDGSYSMSDIQDHWVHHKKAQKNNLVSFYSYLHETD